MKKLIWSFLPVIVIMACADKRKQESRKPDDNALGFQFQEVSELPIQPTLPKLLLNRFKDSIQSLEAWEAHRSYLKQMLVFYQYGQMPPRPTHVNIALTASRSDDGKIHDSYDFTISRNQKSITFRVGLIRPEGEGHYPVIIKNDRYRFDLSEVRDTKARKKYTKQHRLDTDFSMATEMVKRGYVYCKFNREDVVPDVKGPKKGGIFDLYPEHEWGAITAWAWTYQIIIDWLETQSFADFEKIVATGHSRGGKTALCAGIFDERIAITAPNSSGLGGTASLRFYDFSKGPEVQTIPHQTERFPHWWPNRWHGLKNDIDKVPFDAHFAKALIAPRALLNTHARQDYWANPYGTYLTYLRAQPVFDLYEVGHHNAIHWRDGGHAQNEEDWSALLDYCDFIFYDKKPERAFNENPFPNRYQFDTLEPHDITRRQ